MGISSTTETFLAANIHLRILGTDPEFQLKVDQDPNIHVF